MCIPCVRTVFFPFYRVRFNVSAGPAGGARLISTLPCTELMDTVIKTTGREDFAATTAAALVLLYYYTHTHTSLYIYIYIYIHTCIQTNETVFESIKKKKKKYKVNINNKKRPPRVSVTYIFSSCA